MYNHFQLLAKPQEHFEQQNGKVSPGRLFGCFLSLTDEPQMIAILKV